MLGILVACFGALLYAFLINSEKFSLLKKEYYEFEEHTINRLEYLEGEYEAQEKGDIFEAEGDKYENK